MKSSRARKNNSNDDEFDDDHLFVSIDLEAGREELKKILKINEATEQADLDRFKHRLQNDNHPGIGQLKQESNDRPKSSVACQAFLGYGSEKTNFLPNDIGKHGKDCVSKNKSFQPSSSAAGGKKKKSKILEAVESQRLAGRSSMKSKETIGTLNSVFESINKKSPKKHAESSVSKGMHESASMESSIIIMTEQEFHSTSPSSSTAKKQSDKSIQTDAVKTFGRTVKFGTSDRAQLNRSSSDEMLRELIADAMLETNQTKHSYKKTNLNLSTVSDPGAVDGEWSKLDMSPKKASNTTPTDLAALLSKTILDEDEKDDSEADKKPHLDSVSSDEFVFIDHVKCTFNRGEC